MWTSGYPGPPGNLGEQGSSGNRGFTGTPGARGPRGRRGTSQLPFVSVPVSLPSTQPQEIGVYGVCRPTVRVSGTRVRVGVPVSPRLPPGLRRPGSHPHLPSEWRRGPTGCPGYPGPPGPPGTHSFLSVSVVLSLSLVHPDSNFRSSSLQFQYL